MEKYTEQHKFIDNVLPCYGQAILINERITEISVLKWLVSTKQGMFVIVDKDDVVMCQKATESMIVICYNILVKKYETVDKVLDRATYIRFPLNDNIDKHFTFDVYVKPSYVLTVTSDVFDKCLCVIDAENVDSYATKRLIQRKLFSYCKTILNLDLETETKIDWKGECEKICENPADYVFMLDNFVAFTLMFADNYITVND